MQAKEIPYDPDLTRSIAARMEEHSGLAFLDSGCGDWQGKNSGLFWNPVLWVWEDNLGVWSSTPQGKPTFMGTDLWAVLRQVMAQEETWPLPEEGMGPLVGYLSYDWAVRNLLPSSPKPLAVFALYRQGLWLDHGQQRAWLVEEEGRGGVAKRLADKPGEREFRLLAPGITARWSAQDYAQAFARVQAYIQAGDCYQINLSQAFTGRWQGHPWPLYERLRERSRAPFSAYFAHPFGTILSVSPERLVQLYNGQLEARPIKGTRPRAQDPSADRYLAKELQESPKDRAENLMIVDLLRNDLGKVALAGSVAVPKLFALESYDQVHHLVSTIRARLGSGLDGWDALAALFPGGSITGAPKKRAMEIIQELESLPRGIYCGSLGYMNQHGNMDWNILIRSVELRHDGYLQFHGGGAVVADSCWESEYQECLDKVAVFQRVLEEFLPHPEDLCTVMQFARGELI